jgi:tetratricopeptide (TPR) repeat protein
MRRALSLSLGLLLLSFVARAQSARDPDEVLAEGLRLLETKRFGEAITVLDRFKQGAPNDPRAYFYSGVALAEIGNFREAALELERAMRLRPDRAEYPLAFARIALKLQQQTVASQTLTLFSQDKFIKQLSPRGLWSLADLYYELGEIDKALNTLQRIKEEDRTSYPFALRLGNIYVRQAQLDKARAYFEEASKQPHTAGEAYYGLAQALRLQGDTASSKEPLLQAMKIDPSNPQYLYVLGTVCLEIKQYRQAAEYLQRAEAAGKRDQKTYYALLKTYRALGDETKVKEYSDRTRTVQREKSNQQQATPLVAQGMQQLKIGEVSAARLSFEQALKFDPENWVAHNYLAKIYLSSGELDQAFRHLSDIKETRPDAFEHKFLLATYWYQRGDLERALACAETAKTEWPGRAELRKLLASIYASMGRQKEASDEERAAARLDVAGKTGQDNQLP